MASLKYHILKEYANGVMDEKGRFFPFRSWTSLTTDVSAKQGVRYYVHSVAISGQASGGIVAAGSVNIGGTIRGVTTYIGVLRVGSTSADGQNAEANTYQTPKVLLDPNTAVDITISNSTCSWQITYAEVYEQEGEYSI